MGLLMKIIFLILLLSTFVFSKTINNSLLKIHANIMPKVLLLEKNIKEKIKNNTINITIAYEESNYKEMKFLEQSIKREYPNGISGYEIKIEFIDYKAFKECNIDTNILYIFPSSKENIKMLIKGYNDCNTITFASDKEYLKYDAMISIDVGKKVKPIVNLVAVKKFGIAFKPVLLSISKVFKYEE